MKKKKIYWQNRWKTLPKAIRYIFIVSILVVIAIEIGSCWEATNEVCYRLGQFVLKLSYALTTSTIFYFWTNHYPKEKKKIKLHSLLSYKTHDVELQVDYLIKQLLGEDKFKAIDNISYFECSNTLSTLNPAKEIMVNNVFHKGKFTMEDYFKQAISNLLSYCDQVLEYNEYVDTEIIFRISKIKRHCENICYLNMYTGDTMRKYDEFYNIIFHRIELGKATQKNSSYYRLESNADSVVPNKNKKGEKLEGDDIQEINQ